MMDPLLLLLILKIKNNHFKKGGKMAIFIWMNKYNVNVESIDLQHKKLVDLLNTLAEAMSKGKGNDVLHSIFDELVDYTIYHFEEEDKYFDQIDYPHSNFHREEHKKLIDQVSKFQTEFETNKKGISIEVMRFLKQWLIDHISGTDKELGKFLNRSGIK